jgi:hypothetical protein
MLKRNLAALAFLMIGSGLVVLAAEDQPAPTSVAAKAAIDKANQAEKSARLQFERAVIRAKATEISELKDAQRKSMAANDLKEATAIAARIETEQWHLDVLSGREVQTKIVAKGLFQPAGAFPAGTYVVTATGKWSSLTPTNMVDANGARGTYNGIAQGSLVARVHGKVIPIGVSGTVELPTEGLIEFRCWDGDNDSAIADNTGEMVVSLRRQ